MACACANKKKKETSDTMNNDITIEPITIQGTKPETKLVDKTAPANSVSHKRTFANESEEEAATIALKQCYLCAKKHIARAQEFFQEYHTGYPDHIKNLTDSVRVAELDIRKAFLLRQRIMAQLNMGEGELLGNDANALSMREEHLSLANRIRDDRLKLSDDPLYSPNFDQLLVDINILQYRVMEIN
jgi:hypothetical protein